MKPRQTMLLPAQRQRVNDLALTRFGLEVGKRVRQALIRRVVEGNVKYAHKVTRSRTVIVLDHRGQEMAFVYSTVSKEIVSFLGPEAPETAGWRAAQSEVPAGLRAAPRRPGARR